MAQKIENADKWQVVIVEDKADAYLMIGRYLTSAGVKPENMSWKANGYDVSGFADATAHMDLILLDIGLPGQNGYEVLLQLRANPRYEKTRIIAITGHVGIEEMRRARTAGFDSFLGKPLDYDLFPSYLDKIMNKQEQVWESRTQ